MNPILIATILLSVLGILGAVLLVAASKFLAVTEDEKVEQLQAVLPGANCGGLRLRWLLRLRQGHR